MQWHIDTPIAIERCPVCGEYPEAEIDIGKMLFVAKCPNGHVEVGIDVQSNVFTRVRLWNAEVKRVKSRICERK